MTKKKLTFLILFLAVVLLAATAVVAFPYLNHAGIMIVVEDGDNTVECFSDYKPPVAKAYYSGVIYPRNGIEVPVSLSGEVDTSKPGVCELIWSAEYRGCVERSVLRITVIDSVPPEITLIPEKRESIGITERYDDPGFYCEDRVDGDLTMSVIRNERAGTILYRAADSSGNTAYAFRKIIRRDTDAPEITLKGEGSVTVFAGSGEYAGPGYTAFDSVDGDLTSKVIRTGSVDTTQIGDYTLTYTVSDKSGNESFIRRKVTVADPPPPTITLSGPQFITVISGSDRYTEPGYAASSVVDGDLTALVTVSGQVNENAAGVYTLTYSVTDSRGRLTEAKRYVTVFVPPKPQGDFNYTDPDPYPDKVIYLTFDDGPSIHTDRLLAILDKYNVKATFFVVGYGHEEMIGKAWRAGHSIAIHSLTHDYKKIYASEEAFFSDIQAMNEIIRSQTGYYSTLLRFPGGSSNQVSRFNPGIMTRLTKAVTEAGYQYFDWNVSSGDAGATTLTSVVYQNVINGVRGKKVAVVLQHDSKGYSVDAVEDIIIWGLENGYTFLPLTPNSPVCHHGVSN